MKIMFIRATFLCLIVSSALAADPQSPGDLALELIAVKAGSFTLGSPATEPWRNADATTGEGPQTKVTISKPFWLAKTETTRAQYEALMGAVPDPWAKKTREMFAAN